MLASRSGGRDAEPADGKIAAMMIANCKAIGRGDIDGADVDRTVTADPANFDACEKLLDYLDQSGTLTGSPRGFGQSCHPIQADAAQIPLLVAVTLSCLVPQSQAPLYEHGRVWNDVKT